MATELIQAVTESTAVLAQALEPDAAAELAEGYTSAAVAIAIGLAALASGYAERGIGSAAVGAIAEDRSMLGPGILLTVLPETLVIFAIVVIFII